MFPDRKHAKIADILGYTFPRLHEGKKWYVDFRATDPGTGELRRKKYYIPRQKSKREMRAQAAALIEKTSSQLRKGWTPWELNKSIRATTKIDDILGKYIKAHPMLPDAFQTNTLFYFVGFRMFCNFVDQKRNMLHF